MPLDRWLGENSHGMFRLQIRMAPQTAFLPNCPIESKNRFVSVNLIESISPRVRSDSDHNDGQTDRINQYRRQYADGECAILMRCRLCFNVLFVCAKLLKMWTDLNDIYRTEILLEPMSIRFSHPLPTGAHRLT